MEYHIAKELEQCELPGRAIRKCVGMDGKIHSEEMSFGRTMFAPKYGIMQPHHHAEEIIYVLDTKKGYVKFGETEECLGGRVDLKPDMVLHFADQEWHAFCFDEEDGYADILFFYSQIDNLRPEENQWK